MFITQTRRTLFGMAVSALLIGTGSASAAQNDWDRIDDVRFSQQNQERVVDMRGTGQWERIAFRARGSDVRCRSIRIFYHNGNVQYLDRHTYDEDSMGRHDLKGGQRIDEIHFDCRPRGGDHARLVVRGRRD